MAPAHGEPHTAGRLTSRTRIHTHVTPLSASLARLAIVSAVSAVHARAGVQLEYLGPKARLTISAAHNASAQAILAMWMAAGLGWEGRGEFPHLPRPSKQVAVASA
jgi:hypothetical protein